MKKTILIAILVSIFASDFAISQEKELETKLNELKENEAKIISELEQLKSELTRVQKEIAAVEKEIAESEGGTKKATARRAELMKKHNDKEAVDAIMAEKVYAGMTKEMVFDSWGKPDEVDSSIGTVGRHEVWVYGGTQFLYFEDGVLTTIKP
jgi:predicted nuclease with TOPRIM domain